MLAEFFASSEKKIVGLFFTLYFLGFLVINLFWPQKNLMADTLYVFSTLLSVLTGIYAIYYYGIANPRGRALTYITAGAFCWLLAESIWVFLDFFLLESPYPSVADAFFILAYPLIFIGLIKEIAVGKFEWKEKRVLPILGITALLSLLVFYFSVYLAYDPKEDAIFNLFSCFYGVGDLLLLIASALIVLVIWDYRQGKLFFPWLFVASGFIAILIADILFSLNEKEYVEGITGIIKIDLFWVAGYLMIGYGLALIGLSLKEMREKIVAKLIKKK